MLDTEHHEDVITREVMDTYVNCLSPIFKSYCMKVLTFKENARSDGSLEMTTSPSVTVTSRIRARTILLREASIGTLFDVKCSKTNPGHS